jgi:hypothetical protein
MGDQYRDPKFLEICLDQEFTLVQMQYNVQKGFVTGERLIQSVLTKFFLFLQLVHFWQMRTIEVLLVHAAGEPRLSLLPSSRNISRGWWLLNPLDSGIGNNQNIFWVRHHGLGLYPLTIMASLLLT